MALVNFKRGEKPQDVSNLNEDTLYFFKGEKEIYLGKDKIADSVESVTLASEEEIEALFAQYVEPYLSSPSSSTVENTAGKDIRE